MLYFFGVIYAVVFLVVGSRDARIPLMLIFATAPFQMDISGGGPLRFSIAEINIILSLPLLLIKNRPLTLGPLAGGISFYLIVSFACSLLHWRPTSLICLVQMVLYLVVAVMVFSGLPKSEKDYRLAMDALVLVSFVMAATVVVKRSGYVWGLHKNGVGASLGAAVIVCTELWFASSGKRKRNLSVALVVIAAGLFFSLSRGAWLGAIVGIIILITLRGEFRLLFRLGLVVVPLMALCWAYLPDSSRDYATSFDSKANYNIRMRYESVDFAKKIFLMSPITGMGVGLRKEYDATNMVWCTLAETGVVGLLALIVMHVSILRLTWKTQKNLNRASILYSGVALGSALVFSRLLHGMVDHYWGRGPNTVVWSAVGMALFGHFARRRMARAARLRALLDQTKAANPVSEERGAESATLSAR